jgi:hypothetical protein
MATRTRRINTLRGFCREFGMEVSVGAARGRAQIARLLADEHSAIPAMLRTPMRLALEEIRLMEARIDALERELAQLARQSEPCKVLASVPGVGLEGSGYRYAALRWRTATTSTRWSRSEIRYTTRHSPMRMRQRSVEPSSFTTPDGRGFPTSAPICLKIRRAT